MNEAREVVVISGGSRGLGRALVEACLARGYAVATFSRSASEFIHERLAQDPDDHAFYWEAVDGADYEAVKTFVNEVARRYGRINVLINNAAVAHDGLFPLMSPAAIDQGIDLNLKGVAFLTRACARLMLQQQSGCIVNISSVNALRGHAGVAMYSATKAALDGMSRSLAKELGPKNIRVNSVAPGYFDSDMVEHLSETQKNRIIRRTPLGRLGHVDDITQLLLFLISPQASFITGQTIVVDGGLTC